MSPNPANGILRIPTPTSLTFILAPFRWLHSLDPRITIAAILFSYLVLGVTVLGFNRGIGQMAVTTVSTCAFEWVLCRIFHKKWLVPMSALITSLSLSLLLNYSHDYWVLFVPVYFAIGAKYVFTFNGKHVYNPAQVGVVFSLLFASSLITSAPAYQWNGIESMGVFVAGLGIFMMVPKVNRFPLVLSFLFFFSLATLLRAEIMKHHLPFETLFLGTITSPAFFLFTFFMITDPKTSPSGFRQQVVAGFLLALFDLIFHLRQSYYTFFYAGFTLQTLRLLTSHGKAMYASGRPLAYVRERFVDSGYYLRPLILGLIGAAAVLTYKTLIYPKLEINNLTLEMKTVPASHTGIDPELGDVLTRVDPRIQHIVKWLLSVGDSVAAGDYDGDGLADLFFTHTLKNAAHRNSLYRNLGDFRFERVPLPMIAEKTRDIERHGLPSNAMFEDYDGDGDLDLLIVYAFGSPILLKNMLVQTRHVEFVDVTREVGLDVYTNAVAANFIDINRDGRLDLIIGNVWPKVLPNYDPAHPRALNVFGLPQPEYKGDERMFDFMHASWHQADNGGVNDVFFQEENGRFVKADSEKLGLPDHYWTLAIGTGDLNQDGWTDLYVANDFGPDQLYYNDQGKRFVKVQGTMFGDIGRDTYKGMNASLADVDNNGMLDIYVSNVHHSMQAEGSLLWMFDKSDKPGEAHLPRIADRATQNGALNESRFGWGASVTDFDNDGRLDIAQANGMVDDTIDRKFEKCGDYWYVNEKIARSPSSIHRFVNKWGDIRGYCIYGKEKNRLYLNTGRQDRNMFVDVADQAGLDEVGNSRGMSGVDLDNDGKRDLVITHMFHGPTIKRNLLREERSWIGFELESRLGDCNRRGVGSTIRLTAGPDGKPLAQMREVQSVDGFSAQNDPRIHFGLGAHRTGVDVTVSWCGKKRVAYAGLAPGRYHKLVLSE